LVSFFVISLFFHAAVLVYPVSFGGRNQAEVIQVMVLLIEQEGDGAVGQRGSGVPARRGDAKSHQATRPIAEPRVEPKSFANPEPQDSSAGAVATASDSNVLVSEAVKNSAETVGATKSGPTGNDANGSSTGLGGTGSGKGLGSPDTGFGRGSGNGSVSSVTGIGLTQASYRDTPSPAYPESARREGREGRVLVRVLVDDQGRSKRVEINSSSGSDALDRAAAEAIQRWRFHPARQGDQPVESWLRIPIEFRLADAKPR